MDFEDGGIGDIPTRPMRVKILYTFDQDNKTNCLARFPDVLNIPAVAIDESSQVGVIELKQCIQAIIAASPELISRLSDGDFTIYAYDYSEDDTPLVGQGMLSAALAVAATPNQQHKMMITGRVCKNMMALFSNGVKETLEVKLRLVPVPRPAQIDITKSIDSLRSMSAAVSGGFDPNAWNASMQQNKNQQQSNDYFNFEAIASGGDRDMALVDDIFGLATTSSGSGGGQQMTGGVGMAETPNDSSYTLNPAFSHSAPGSRAGSPMMGSESSSRSDLLRHQSFSGNTSNFADLSRPTSRASVRSEVRHQRQDSTSSSVPQQHPSVQQQTEIHYNEDGQSRKRAKVTQTDWRGRSLFGSKSADLRVTAATASSMHMHRPIAKKPAAPGSDLEPPPRVPTPVPQRTLMFPHQQNQQIAPRRSLLRQASTADSDFLSDVDNFSDAIMSSPEEESPGNSITAEGTPQEIPSSPPVFSGINQPQPSSPGLPTLPPARMTDSGYMSELRGLASSNDMVDNEEDRSPDAQDYEIAAQYQPRGAYQTQYPVIKTEGSTMTGPPTYPMSYVPPTSVMNIELEMPGDMNQLPHKMLLNLPPSRYREGSQGPTRASKSAAARNTPKPVEQPLPSPTIGTAMPSLPRAPSQTRAAGPAQSVATPVEQPSSRRGSLALPPKSLGLSSDLPDPAAPRPVPRQRQSIQRSRTSSNDSEAGSPAPSDTEGKPRGPGRSGSGAQRRKIIEQRLQKSIAKGEMPQYCSHCGAIETPTWRRLYVKECDGKPSPLDSAEGEGETIGVEVTETDETTGEATKFMIRKSMKKTKECVPGAGFKDLVVCNPCGLWFNKFRFMRPPEKWNRKSGTRKSKKQKAIEPGFSTDGMEPPSDACFTDQAGAEDAVDEEEGQADDFGPSDTMPPPIGRPRANSMQAQQVRRTSGQGGWNASQLDAALVRAVQSSPVRYQGSQASPIEIEDLTPRPTRRLLFPSPRRDGEVRSLDDNGQVSLKSMPPSGKGLMEKQTLSPKPGMELNFQASDTNVFEAFTFDKENVAPGLEMEDDDLAHLFEGSPSALFRTPKKTPSKPTPKSLQHLMKTPTPGSRNRKPLTPNPNAANLAQDFMTSPSSMRYFLRSTPSRIERTPGGGRSRNSGGSRTGKTQQENVSPWSRHLAQMLSEANTFTSPSRQFDFSDLPTFNTPGRGLTDGDWDGLEGIFSEGFDGSGAFDGSDLMGGSEGLEGQEM